MDQPSPNELRPTAADGASAPAPLSGTKVQIIQRLQIGIGGVVVITLLVGLVSLIEGRADLTEQSAVPQAAATTAPEDAPVQPDPLAEAGVVPDLPASPSPEPEQEQPILPEQGTGGGIVPDLEAPAPAAPGSGQ
jgi:hypothetical protein